MNEINDDIQEKDDLFYDDVMYKIKKVAGFEVKDDEEVNARIELRLKLIKDKDNYEVYHLSDFEVELFKILIKIGDRLGICLIRLEEIAKYPDLVEEELRNLENIKNELIDGKLKVKKMN